MGLVSLVGCGPSLFVEPEAEGGGDGNASTDGGGATSGFDPNPPAPLPPEPPGTSTTAPSGDSDSDGGNGFISPVDAGEAYQCELGGDDCGPGEKCVPYDMDGFSSWNATRCVAIVPDPAGLGDPCEQELNEHGGWTGNDDCGDQAICWDFDPEAPGACKGLCENGLDCQDPGAVPYVGCQNCFCVCETPCNPLADDCLGHQMCVVTGRIATCVPDASGEGGAFQDPCEFVNVCDPGLFCANSDSVAGCDDFAAGCCTPYCDTQAPDCPASMQCEPLYPDGGGPDSLQFVGMCLLPE